MTFPEKKMTFRQAVDEGVCELSDISDWIEGWHFPHDADDMSDEMVEFAESSELHEFMGMTERQCERIIDDMDDNGSADAAGDIFEED